MGREQVRESVSDRGVDCTKKRSAEFRVDDFLNGFFDSSLNGFFDGFLNGFFGGTLNGFFDGSPDGFFDNFLKTRRGSDKRAERLGTWRFFCR